MNIDRNTAQTVVFLLVDKDDAVTGVPDLKPKVEVSKNGAAFTTVSGTVKSIGGGWYSVTLTAAETNTAGPLIFRASHAETYEWRDIHQVISPAVTLADADVARIAAAVAAYGLTLKDEAYTRIAQAVKSADLTLAEEAYERITAAIAATGLVLADDAYSRIKAAVAGAGIELAEETYDRIADHVLRRDFAAASTSAHGDGKTFRSLLGAVAKNVNRVALDGRTLIIYEADDETRLATQSVAVNGDAPVITALDTDE